MITLNVVNNQGKKKEGIELSDVIFNTDINENTVRISLNQYLANQRRGTAATKTKGLVSGGGIKPWKQKGTGRARCGSNRSPIWRGGGTVFGPQPRSYNYKVNHKVKQSALRSALTSLAQEENIFILDNLDFDAPKTKSALELLKNLNAVEKILILLDQPSDNVILSFRNIANAKLIRVENLNIFDLLHFDKVITTVSTIKKVEEMLS